MSAPRPCFRAEFREGREPWQPLSKLQERQARRQKRKGKQKRPPEIQTSRLLDERLAAQWAGYTWPQYLALPGDDRWVNYRRYADCKAWVLAAYHVSLELDGLKDTLWH